MPDPLEHLSPVPSDGKGKQSVHARGHSKASSVAGSVTSATAKAPVMQPPTQAHFDRAAADGKKTDAPTADIKLPDPKAALPTPPQRYHYQL